MQRLENISRKKIESQKNLVSSFCILLKQSTLDDELILFKK